jgi:hypothetical protein
MGLSNQIPASRLIQPGVCTSATRPDSPFEGQVIYETDTDKVLVWNGSAWYQTWNQPWGNLGYVSLTSGVIISGITSVTDITNATITFTAVANRKYRASWHGYCNTTASYATTNVMLYEGTTLLQQSTSTAGTATIGSFNGGQYIGTHAAGSVTWKLRLQLQAGTGTCSAEGGSTYPFTFSIDDIGPV